MYSCCQLVLGRVLPSVKFVLNTYSRKVFIGGLPPDISAGRCILRYMQFGHMYVAHMMHTQIIVQMKSQHSFQVLVPTRLTGHTDLQLIYSLLKVSGEL